MRFLVSGLAATLLAISVGSTAAQAEQGVVVWTGGCSSRYVVETPAGYVLLEWFGGHDPFKGERLVGELNSYGMKDLYVLPSGNSTRAWIDDFMLSRSSVVEKLRDKCGDS
jgi:hypothetical protein